MAVASQRRWPARIEYAAAIRTPAACLLDPELQGGVTAINPGTGQPLMRSGQFSSVFHLATAETPFAIKCFVRSQAGRQARSRTLSEVLGACRRPWYVPFDFQDPGIRVASEVFPLVKMEWIDGASLDEYITEHLGDGQCLIGLAQRFRRIVEDVEVCGWAHGDLQHGNLIVLEDGELKLVDYDGMYVPQLSKIPSRENGHPNYQHPARISGELDLYGPELDRYAAWVIYTSILICAHDPDSWERYDGGDNKLLLSAADFRDLGKSRALLEWRKSTDNALRQISTALTAALSHTPEKIPVVRPLQAETLIVRTRSSAAAGSRHDAAAQPGRSALRIRIDEQSAKRRESITKARAISAQARHAAAQQARDNAPARATASSRVPPEPMAQNHRKVLLAILLVIAATLGTIFVTKKTAPHANPPTNPETAQSSTPVTTPSQPPTPPVVTTHTTTLGAGVTISHNRPPSSCVGSDTCEVLVKETVYQSNVGGVQTPLEIGHKGEIITWTIKLGAVERSRLSAIDAAWGGAPAARISILRPVSGTIREYEMTAQSPLESLAPHLGALARFHLRSPLPVDPSDEVALSVPTWAPAFHPSTDSDELAGDLPSARCNGKPHYGQFALDRLGARGDWSHCQSSGVATFTATLSYRS